MRSIHWGSVALGVLAAWFLLPMLQQLVAKGKSKS